MIGLGEERAHGMPQQKDGQAGVLGRGGRGLPRGDRRGPARSRRARRASPARPPRAAPMAPMIRRVDRPARGGHGRGEPLVAGGVLGHAVSHEEDRLGAARREARCGRRRPCRRKQYARSRTISSGTSAFDGTDIVRPVDGSGKQNVPDSAMGEDAGLKFGCRMCRYTGRGTAIPRPARAPEASLPSLLLSDAGIRH